jgi:8-amino-7-oxononanoate synthase
VNTASERLDEIRRAGLHRKLRMIDGPQGPRVTLAGLEVLLLCSNNYLGLADHPAVRRAAAEAAERFGAGAGASRLISGTMGLHRKLERRIAEFSRAGAALAFGSGYLANVGTVSTLAGPDRVVFSDELNHASIIDGCRLARAETFVYRHRDVDHLEWGLRRANGRGALIVTESVFSMDGDVAPLGELVELARANGCLLMVDEAHAVGALGPGGRGAVAEAGLERDVDVIVGTLGKSLGSYGAYVCASAELCELLVNTARTFIFSTAPPPPAIGAALAAVEVLASQPGLVDQLGRNAATLRAELAACGFDTGESRTQVMPVVVGDARRAVELCERCLDHGVFAQAIRPPTVPEGTSRLRLSVMSAHRADELRAAAHKIASAAHEIGLEAAAPAPQLRRAA